MAVFLGVGAGAGATVVTAAATTATKIGPCARKLSDVSILFRRKDLKRQQGAAFHSGVVDIAEIGYPRPFVESERLMGRAVASVVCRQLYVVAANQTRQAEAHTPGSPGSFSDDDSATACVRPAQSTNSCSQYEVLGHGLRGFVRERGSGKYLTVVDGERHATCVLTDKAASLMVCRCAKGAVAGSPTAVAFAHEGLPSFGRFLSCKPPRMSWRHARLPLWCAGKGSSGAEAFLRHANSTIQHKLTGFWLWAEPETGNVVLHPTEQSEWDIVPAT